MNFFSFLDSKHHLFRLRICDVSETQKIVNIKATYSSETSDEFRYTSRSYIPEVKTPEANTDPQFACGFPNSVRL
jgi:hypothetical protein